MRLRKRADFVKLLSASGKYAVKGFLVVWNDNDVAGPRLGITVSRKVGCAVIRNRVKRFTREVFRHHRLAFPAVDINIIARRDAALMDFRSVQMELEKAFRRIGATTCLRAVCSL